VLVEAKSRQRAGVMGRGGQQQTSPDVMFRRLISNAVAKDPHNPLALFVDSNLPPERAQRFYEPQPWNSLIPGQAMSALIEMVRKEYANVDPYNILIFSNHPQHYSLADVAPPNRMEAFLSQKSRVPVFRVKAS
jgi:hypothetical protein